MFTTRRIALAGGGVAAIAIVIVAAILLTGGGSPSPIGAVQGIQTGGATPLKSTPTPKVSVVPSSPTASPTAAPGGGGGTTTTTTGGGQVTTQPPANPSNPNSCDDRARHETEQVSAPSYTLGQTATATVTAQNLGSDCTVSSGALRYVVTNSSTQAVQATATQQVIAAGSTWAAGQTLTTTVSWQTTATGTYTISVQWLGNPPMPTLSQSFTVTGAHDCPATDFVAGLTTGTTYTKGSPIVMTGTIKNNSSETCNIGQSSNTMVVTDSHGTKVFASGLGGGTSGSTLAPGQSLTFPYSWNQENCVSGGCAQVPAGTYTVTSSSSVNGTTFPDVVLNVTIT